MAHPDAERQPVPNAASPATVTRRILLGGVGASLALAACTNGGEPTTTATSSSTGTPTPTLDAGEDIVQRALDVVGVDAPIGLQPVTFSPEVLTGPNRGFTFGLIDAAQNPAPGLDIELWFVSSDAETVAGPYATTFYATEEPALTRGVYFAEISLEASGTYDVVVATRDRSIAGTGVAQVRGPSQADAPAPGTTLPLATTPTTADPQNLEILCTREPDCSMHDMSIDAAIASGHHVVLTIATPAFCDTTLCGPTVDVVEAVKNAASRDDVTFIHVEVYRDAGNTPTDYVTQLKLPSEPWTFLIGNDGIVVDRFGGPVIPEVLSTWIADLPVAPATPTSTQTGTETPTSTDAPTTSATSTDQ